MGPTQGESSHATAEAAVASPRPARSRSRRRSSVPDSWANLDEMAASGPVHRTERRNSLEYRRSPELALGEDAIELDDRPRHESEAGSRRSAGKSSRSRRRSSVPEQWANLDEVAACGPVQQLERRNTLEHARSREQAAIEEADGPDDAGDEAGMDESGQQQPSKLAIQVYTHSYLVFFSILGTLARVGLSALTKYPAEPVIFSTVWANFGGSLVMGFLVEDQMLFRDESDDSSDDERRAKKADGANENESSTGKIPIDDPAVKKRHMAIKKTIPLYIGLATGFCGSFTSFSAFIRDMFLAVGNNLVVPGVAHATTDRNGGYSFMALLAVVIVTTSLSLSGLFLGAHLAVALQKLIVRIPFAGTRRVLDWVVIVLGWGSWVGAIFLAIFPPQDFWRGRIVFSLVFAPLGTFLRFYLSLYLNARFASFPLGTFTANVFGTAVLGMAWDIAHAQIGGVVSCQVLQGIEDGFCGCLTTVSTWVVELSSLRRKHAYAYGFTSVVVAFAALIAIMGGLRWSGGFDPLLCSV